MKKQVRMKLDKYLDSRDISRYKLAQMTEIKYQTIDAYYKNKVQRYDIEILSKICNAMKCEISDIMELI